MKSVPERPLTMAEARTRELIQDRIDDLTKVLHYADAIGSGETWETPLTLSCGFRGRLVIHVDDIGACERRSAPVAAPPARRRRRPKASEEDRGPLTGPRSDAEIRADAFLAQIGEAEMAALSSSLARLLLSANKTGGKPRRGAKR